MYSAEQLLESFVLECQPPKPLTNQIYGFCRGGHGETTTTAIYETFSPTSSAEGMDVYHQHRI